MNGLSYFGLLFLIALSLPTYAQPQTTDTLQRGPVFHLIGGQDRDLGTLRPQKYVGSIFITNPGDDTLRILDVRNSGGNILGRLRDETIAPGDTGRIEVWGDFTSRYGPATKAFIVHTNDRHTPQNLVRFRVDVRPDIIVEPRQSYLVINDLGPGKEGNASISLRPGWDTAITLCPPSIELASSDYVVITDLAETLQLKAGEERKVLIRVTTNRAASMGESIGTIKFPTAPSSSISYTLYRSPN